MPDEIRPALSAEEWAARVGDACPQVERGGEALYLVRADGVVNRANLVGIAHWERAGVATPHVHELMALANAALPDGDPRKLTHEDVEACCRFDFNFWGMESDSVLVQRADCEALQRLAAKLRALLPPREDT